jgi:hypothetical protein
MSIMRGKTKTQPRATVLSLTISPKKAQHNLISDLSGGITDEQRRTGASKAVLANPLSQLDFSTICSLLELGISLCDAWPRSLRTSLARERERERERERYLLRPIP